MNYLIYVLCTFFKQPAGHTTDRREGYDRKAGMLPEP